MILKGSQRGGAADLAAHLLDDRENDHVTVVDLRGFVARDLHGAFAEAHAVSKGTKCGQFLFSLSLSPPKQAEASERDLMAAVERAEATLDLTGQPRAVVLHEKNGRRHAHAVWSRIDAGSNADRRPGARLSWSVTVSVEIAERADVDGFVVWETNDEIELSAHRLDIAAQGGKQDIGPLLDARHVILCDAEDFGEARLGQLARLAEFLQRFVFGDQFPGPRLCFLASGGTQVPVEDVI